MYWGWIGTTKVQMRRWCCCPSKNTLQIEITMKPDEESNYTPEEKVTYQKIKAYILEKYGFKVSLLYIAQVKDKCGLGKECTGRKMIRQRSNSVHLKGK